MPHRSSKTISAPRLSPEARTCAWYPSAGKSPTPQSGQSGGGKTKSPPLTKLVPSADPKTTRRYTHGTERAKQAAVEATSRRELAGGEQRVELSLVAK
ncbi:MAG: hypothetical protein LC800_21475 [Acidobacteria bacterium]|nr:hypothetical protein [Acidobacteriota bacterium]